MHIPQFRLQLHKYPNGFKFNISNVKTKGVDELISLMSHIHTLSIHNLFLLMPMLSTNCFELEDLSSSNF